MRATTFFRGLSTAALLAPALAAAQQRPAMDAGTLEAIEVRSLGPGLVTGRIADIAIDANDTNAGTVKTPEVLHFMDGLQQRLAALPQVGASTGITDIVKKVRFELSDGDSTMHAIPDSEEEISQELSSLTSKFSENVLDATHAWTKLINDVDALAGGPGRAIDLALKLRYDIDPRWAVTVGYRTVEGGADVESVYNFAWFNSAAVAMIAESSAAAISTFAELMRA